MLTRLRHDGRQFGWPGLRQSQALHILTVDRLARSGTGRPTPLGRAWARQLDLVDLVRGDPLGHWDGGYTHVRGFIDLHQEFTHRIFEAMDTRKIATKSASEDCNVFQFPYQTGR